MNKKSPAGAAKKSKSAKKKTVAKKTIAVKKATAKKAPAAKKTTPAKKAASTNHPRITIPTVAFASVSPTRPPASTNRPRIIIPTVQVDVKLVNGDVVVKATEITRDQEAHWTCKVGHLEIVFDPKTPFGGTTYRTAKGGGCFSGRPKSTGIYSYTVRVYTDAGVKQGAAQLTVK